jgi:FdhD protein
MRVIETHRVSQYIQYSSGAAETRSSDIAVEAEVTLSVNGETWLSFRCSPDNLAALAVGYLYNETFIQSAAEVASRHVCAQGDVVDIWLYHAVQKPTTWGRTAGCQGGAVQVNPAAISPVNSPARFPIADVFALLERFLTELAKPELPQHGVHTTMLLDQNDVQLISTDIGRHNTLDKIAGDLLLKQLSLSAPVVVTTGRISSEMVYKTARMNIPLVISLHSISHMAIQAAETLGITLIGHARRKQIDVYSHPERILSAK